MLPSLFVLFSYSFRAVSFFFSFTLWQIDFLFCYTHFIIFSGDKYCSFYVGTETFSFCSSCEIVESFECISSLVRIIWAQHEWDNVQLYESDNFLYTCSVQLIDFIYSVSFFFSMSAIVCGKSLYLQWHKHVDTGTSWSLCKMSGVYGFRSFQLTLLVCL